MDLLPRSIQVPRGDPKLHAEKLKVWNIVLEAQTAASREFKANNTAASVDLAARKIIENAGYGHAFTHRLGHGIGIKGMYFLNLLYLAGRSFDITHSLLPSPRVTILE